MRRIIVLTFSLIALLLLAARPASASDDLLGSSLLDGVGEVVEETVDVVSVDSTAEEAAPVDESSAPVLDNAVSDIVAPVVEDVAAPIVDNTVNDVVEPAANMISETVAPVTDAVIPPPADTANSTEESGPAPDSSTMDGVAAQTLETVSVTLDTAEDVAGSIEPVGAVVETTEATDLVSGVAGSDETSANEPPVSDQQSTGLITDDATPLLAETLSNLVAPVAGIALVGLPVDDQSPVITDRVDRVAPVLD